MRPAGSAIGRRAALGWIGLGAAQLLGRPARAQAPTGTLRVALLSQWTLDRHRGAPELTRMLDQGVVDRTVFAWQRGVIPRVALVWKPVRVLPEAEAEPLGGRGSFDLAAVRPPAGPSAWTEIVVTLPPADPTQVAVIEIGGERNTVAQVLETLLVRDPSGGLGTRPLSTPALWPGPGVRVVRAPFGRPVTAPEAAGRFTDVGGGLEVLVVRSQVDAIRNGDLTPSGPADTAPLGAGDWREGDRVLLRVSAAVLGQGPPGLVLGWKDRTLMPDPDGELPRRSALPFPIFR